MKVIFFGTPSFAARILEYLIVNNINVVAVVTQSDKRRGKISEVKKVAESISPKIEIFQPEKATCPKFIESIKKYNPDLFVVVAYGKILRQSLLDVPNIDSINVHGSILPKYRGAAPIQRVIMKGEKKTGITIMQMTRGLDSGDVIDTKEIPIDKNINFGKLHDQLCEIAKPLLLDVIKKYEKGKVKKYPQEEKEATYAEKITSEDQPIDFNKDASIVHNQIRGLSPFPGARCLIEINQTEKKVKIIESEIVELNGTPKEILKFENHNFIIACKKNAISIKKLQIEGKKPILAPDFIRGIKTLIKIL